MLFGSIINVICIIMGTFAGLVLTKIGDKYKETIMQGIALTVILIGLQMALETNAVIIILISIVFGALLGELLRLETILNRFGEWVTSKFKNKDNSFNIGQGFVTASLIFGVGAMAILGSLDSGLRGDHEILLTKSVLDGFTSLVLTSTLGIGVIFSAIPVFLFQGAVTLFASQIEAIIPPELLHQQINEITAVGGLIIVAIGLNLLNITKVRVTNLLPALPIVAIMMYIGYLF